MSSQYEFRETSPDRLNGSNPINLRKMKIKDAAKKVAKFLIISFLTMLLSALIINFIFQLGMGIALLPFLWGASFLLGIVLSILGCKKNIGIKTTGMICILCTVIVYPREYYLGRFSWTAMFPAILYGYLIALTNGIIYDSLDLAYRYFLIRNKQNIN